MACYGGQPHDWDEVVDLRQGTWYRLRCVVCQTKKWKKAWFG